MKLLLICLLAYLAYCGLLFVAQRWMLFPSFLVSAPRGVAEKTARLERIWIDTRHGKVEAWYIPPENRPAAEPAPAVLFAHGNGELIDFWPETLRRFTELGTGLLLVEYPGYGRSEGAPSQESITEAFTSAYDVLVSREDVDAGRIVLFGRSLGGGAVCALAAKRPSRALILMSTFTSVRSLARRYLVPPALVRDPFDNLAVVRAYEGPVLIIHGRSDEVVPYKHGQMLHRAASHSRMITDDSGHNDCPANWESFWENAASFLRDSGVIQKDKDEKIK